MPCALINCRTSLTLVYRVIAVHGFGAHPVNTWVEKSEGWNWLERQLVDLIPRASVWTFGYDSTWTGDQSVSTRLSEITAKLLDAIKQKVQVFVHVVFNILNPTNVCRGLSRAR